MIITCPECASQFLVDRNTFGSGPRKVRCSNCGYSWRQPVVDDPTPRRPMARTANRLNQSPPDTDLPVGNEMAKAVEAAGEDETRPADSAIESALDAAEPASSSLDEETTADTDEAVDAPEPVDPAPDSDDAQAKDKPDAEDSIDFTGEDTNAAVDQSKTIEEADEQVQDQDIDDDKKPEPVSTDTEDGPVAAHEHSSKAQWRRWAFPAAAAASVVLVIGGLVFARDGIVHAFPGWASAYEAVGLSGQPVAGAGLEFHQVTSRREWSGPEEVLIVHGKIANVTDDRVSVPLVRVALYDVDDFEIQAVTVANALPTISPGEEIPFEARIPSPAISAQRIRVSFDALEAETQAHDAS